MHLSRAEEGADTSARVRQKLTRMMKEDMEKNEKIAVTYFTRHSSCFRDKCIEKIESSCSSLVILAHQSTASSCLDTSNRVVLCDRKDTTKKIKSR